MSRGLNVSGVQYSSNMSFGATIQKNTIKNFANKITEEYSKETAVKVLNELRELSPEIKKIKTWNNKDFLVTSADVKKNPELVARFGISVKHPILQFIKKDSEFAVRRNRIKDCPSSDISPKQLAFEFVNTIKKAANFVDNVYSHTLDNASNLLKNKIN